MPKSASNKALVTVLWVNAGLLVLLIVAVWTRSGPTLIAPAMGQSPTNIGGGSGIYIMPAQFTSTGWGCYLVDVDRETLAAYQYDLGEKQLTLKAVRSFKYDLALGNYDTFPSPDDIEKLVKDQAGKPDNVPDQIPAPAPTPAPNK